MSKTKATAKANFEKTERSAAVNLSLKLVTELRKIGKKVTVAGSIRQGKDMIGDIDIVVVPNNSDTFYDDVKGMIEYEYGGKKKIFGMFEGRPINIFVTSPESFGACLYQSTGPAKYNIQMRGMAKRKGFKLNEYGLFDRDTNEKVAGKTEQEIFEAMKMTWKSPNERGKPKKKE